jgi:CheY-like chemotaxis protein
LYRYGAGLPLSYNIINALGGELCFTSDPGNTKFYFSLPYMPTSKESAKASVAAPAMCAAAAYDAIPTTEAKRIVITKEEAAQEMSQFGTNFDTIMSTMSDTVESSNNDSTNLNELLSSAARLVGDEDEMHSSHDKAPNASRAPHPTEATFISIPDPAKVITPSSVANHGLAAMEPPHVLVVEDTPMCWKVLKMSLTKMKCTVDVAEDGAQALKAVKRSMENGARPYKLVLMDLRMPVMDGFETTRVLKDEIKFATPIVALTAETGSDVRERCKEIGFDEFLQKPLSKDLLKTILSKFARHVVG